jgi:hypothetical protein
MISQKGSSSPLGIEQYLHEKLPPHSSDYNDRNDNDIARESENILYEVASDLVAHFLTMGCRRT